MKYRQISIALIATLLTSVNVKAQPLLTQPKLLVTVIVDQLRSDYLEAFAPLYGEEGFKKLLQQGLVYSNASYSFSPIDRASAITSIVTGTQPYYHSITRERWLDKTTLRPVLCIEDHQYEGIFTTDRVSPRNVATSTFLDELKLATKGKGLVFSVSPFMDASVLAGGHAANGALWIDDKNGKWCTSSFYTQSNATWLKAINALMSPAYVATNTVWEASSPLSANVNYFLSGDNQLPFKHKFNTADNYREFKTSALVNEQVTQLALQCIKGNAMGGDAITDLCSVTYYAGTFNHAPVTDCQMELQDTYVRLDAEIGKLVSELERSIGKNNVVFVMTSTGCCDEESVDYFRYNIPTGNIDMSRTANLLNMYYGALWGSDKYIETTYANQIFLNHKLLEQKRIGLKDATDRAQEFLCQLSGIRHIYTAQQLLTDTNQQIEKIRKGFHPEHCGDIIVEISPGWNLQNPEYNQNKTSRSSYIPFPIIIYGLNHEAQKISDAVSVEQIAPTVSKIIRIRAPNACSLQPLF